MRLVRLKTDKTNASCPSHTASLHVNWMFPKSFADRIENWPFWSHLSDESSDRKCLGYGFSTVRRLQATGGTCWDWNQVMFGPKTCLVSSFDIIRQTPRSDVVTRRRRVWKAVNLFSPFSFIFFSDTQSWAQECDALWVEIVVKYGRRCVVKKRGSWQGWMNSHRFIFCFRKIQSFLLQTLGARMCNALCIFGNARLGNQWR